jgi:hypothetical protein
MTIESDLLTRVRLKEALVRVNDARCTATDSWTASRLELIALDIEETLAHLVPDRIGPCPRKVAAARQSR